MAQIDLEKYRDKLIYTIDISKRKLEAINLLLSDEPTNDFDLFSESNKSEERPAKADTAVLGTQFPARGKSGAQMLFLFNNLIDRGSRISDVEDIYNKCILQTNGTKRRVDNALRKLLKEGKLVMVKYNGYNRESYYGLPSWIEDNNFRDERRPKNDYLEIESVDITSYVK